MVEYNSESSMDTPRGLNQFLFAQLSFRVLETTSKQTSHVPRAFYPSMVEVHFRRPSAVAAKFPGYEVASKL